MDFRICELQPVVGATVHGEIGFDALPNFFGWAFGEVFQAAQQCGETVTGAPFAYYPSPPSENTVVVEAGFPTSHRLEPEGRVHPIELPAGTAVRAMHIGPYDALSETYEAMRQWMAEQGLVPAESMWESYLSDPSVEPDPANWRTEITWPVHHV